MGHKLTKFRKNRQFHNNTWRSQCSTFSNIRKPERLMTVKLYYNPSRPTRLIQRTSSNNSPLFKGTHNTVPDRPHKQPQNKSQKFQTTEIIQSISQWNGMEWGMEWNETRNQ